MTNVDSIKNTYQKIQPNNSCHNTEAYLSMKIIQKMLNKFLVNNGMSKEKLAQLLNISVKELWQLLSCKTVPELITRVSLPLVRLFCETKFEDKR